MIHRVYLLLLSFSVILTTGLTAHAEDSIRVTSDNFTLSGHIEAKVGLDMISELERFRSALFEIHDLPPEKPDRRVDIYVISDPEIFDILGVSKEFIAIYAPTVAGPRALVNGVLQQDSSELRHSLRHEYAHHFIYTHLDLTPVRWLTEGLAEYYAGYRENADGSYDIGFPLAMNETVLSFPIEGWYGMYALLRNFNEIRPGPYRAHRVPAGWIARPDGTTFFYSQSWALIHWAINQSGETDIEAGIDLLSKLADRLLVNEMPFSRDLSAYPELLALRTEGETLVDATAKSVEIELGYPLEPEKGTIDNSDTLERILASYVAAGAPTLTRPPEAGRQAASIEINTLSPTEAAAIQYRQMSLTAGSRALISPRMMSLREEITGDPDLAASLLVSEAAQQLINGGTQAAVDRLAEALALDSDLEDALILSVHTAYGDFTNRNFMNPQAMRDKLRPLLTRYPDQPDFLVMMATTGLGDVRQEGESFSAEALAAFEKAERLNIITRNPHTALPLVNIYIYQEDYDKALELLYRIEPFLDRNNFEIGQIINRIRQYQNEDRATP